MIPRQYFKEKGFSVESSEKDCYEEVEVEKFSAKNAVRALLGAEVVFKPGQVPTRILGMNDLSAAEIKGMVQCCQNETLTNNFIQANEYLTEYYTKPFLKTFKKYKLYGDVHLLTASLMYSVAIEKAKPYRTDSKTISLGLIYSRGTAAIAQQLGITFEEAEKLIKKFFNQFPGLKEQIEDLQKYPIYNDGYIENNLGRRRNLMGMLTGVRRLEARQFRQSANSLVQGFTSDVNNEAINTFRYHMDRTCEEAKLEIHAPIHDATLSSFLMQYDYFLKWVHSNIYSYNEGVRKNLSRWFKFDFNVPFNIDLQVSLCGVPKNNPTMVYGWSTPIDCEVGGIRSKKTDSKIEGGLAKLTWCQLLEQYFLICGEVHEDTKLFLKETEKDILFFKRKKDLLPELEKIKKTFKGKLSRKKRKIERLKQSRKTEKDHGVGRNIN